MLIFFFPLPISPITVPITLSVFQSSLSTELSLILLLSTFLVNRKRCFWCKIMWFLCDLYHLFICWWWDSSGRSRHLFYCTFPYISFSPLYVWCVSVFEFRKIQELCCCCFYLPRILSIISLHKRLICKESPAELGQETGSFITCCDVCWSSGGGKEHGVRPAG